MRKDILLNSCKNSKAKLYIKVNKKNGWLYILCNTFSTKITAFTDVSILDFSEAFWKHLEFSKAVDNLLENVMFVTSKNKWPFCRKKVHTIKRTVDDYVAVIRYLANW